MKSKIDPTKVIKKDPVMISEDRETPLVPVDSRSMYTESAKQQIHPSKYDELTDRIRKLEEELCDVKRFVRYPGHSGIGQQIRVEV